ncbi:uncharacterized protein LOC131607771 [Vicia villosa]|uniref:uncharacterized protein LOC131607771 n=1 Tax=Vicia villosa TaxID=3911 RepID=UPI00273ABEE8|nr:uncharacterized protein LOC131607771 [Vicia villosa]
MFISQMCVVHSPFTHVPNNHNSLFRISSPITLHHLSKEPIPKLTFASSSSSSILHNVVVSSNERDSKEDSEFFDENEQHLKEENEFVEEKERTRRTRIGLANKGKVPWNKGRKHTAETRELIRIRTLEAMRDPKVKKKMKGFTRSHSEKTKAKISYSQSRVWHEKRRVWHEQLKSKRERELLFLLWKQNIANAAMKGGSDQEELDWDSYDKIKEQLELQKILRPEAKKKRKADGKETHSVMDGKHS